MKTEQWVIEHQPFVLPESMNEAIKKVFAGSYNLEARKWAPDLPHRPVILDLGANVGAFSVFAVKRWPGCKVEAYEPVPELYALAKQNLGYLTEVKLHNAAVAAADGERPFYLGAHNDGEGSLFDINAPGETPSLNVKCVGAASLPKADIIKVDIEGAEWEFLDNYPHLADAYMIAVEYHAEGDKEKIEAKLTPLGFVLVSAKIGANDPGELIFAKSKDMIKR
jgi:FkbM family methyltransferase